jgi:predicted dehydrogenase
MKLALIGFGYWSKNYFNTIKEMDDISLDYICDSNDANLKNIRKKYPNINCLNDFNEILEKKIDGAIIVTPSSTHFDIAKKFLENGINVLVEKPMTIMSDDAKRLYEKADESGKILMVGHIFKYNPALNIAKKIVDSGEMGEIRYIESRRVGLGPIRNDVSALWDLATHDIYISNYLVGKMPTKISCIGISHNSKIEDIVSVNMKFGDQVLSTVYANWEHPVKERKIYIGGSKKAILFDDIELSNKISIFDKGVTYQPSSGDFAEFIASLRDGDISIPQVPNTPPLKTEIEHFLKCIKGEEKCFTNGKEGYEVVKILEIAEESKKNGGIELDIK